LVPRFRHAHFVRGLVGNRWGPIISAGPPSDFGGPLPFGSRPFVLCILRGGVFGGWRWTGSSVFAVLRVSDGLRVECQPMRSIHWRP
jgi:hypothetical protein